MRVHLINPSHLAFGVAVITPRWLYVLAAATPAEYGDPVIVDETLVPLDPESIAPGDVVGIGIHSGNALRGYEVGRQARAARRQGHLRRHPRHALSRRGPRPRRRARGRQGRRRPDLAAGHRGCLRGRAEPIYDGGRVEGDARCSKARWDLLPPDRYMWASVQTVRGCPKHCSFCSVWRTDGQKPRAASSDAVIEEIVELRRRGFRFIALADDNFYPVALERSAARGSPRRQDDARTT